MCDDVSRYIPAHIKRTVRQRCRFGCVICGLPVYHYEHMNDFADVQEHTAENLTLLCPNHHQEKTSRRLPRAIVERANANPYNGQRDFTADHRLFFDGDDVNFDIGGNIFGSTLSEGESFTAVQIGNIQFAGFKRENESLLLNLQINDIVMNPILTIIDGEVAINTGVEDVTMIGPNLTLRPSFMIKPIKINFADNGVNISSGKFYGWGNILEVSPQEARFSRGLTLRGCRTMDCKVGISA